MWAAVVGHNCLPSSGDQCAVSPAPQMHWGAVGWKQVPERKFLFHIHTQACSRLKFFNVNKVFSCFWKLMINWCKRKCYLKSSSCENWHRDASCWKSTEVFNALWAALSSSANVPLLIAWLAGCLISIYFAVLPVFPEEMKLGHTWSPNTFKE